MKEFRRNFSYDESTVIDNVPIHAMERQELTNHIRKKRRVVLVLVASMFVVTSIIMIMSVIHVEMNKGAVGYQELVCAENDEECLKLLCPVGFKLNRTTDQCNLIEGYECCENGHYVCDQGAYTRCFPASKSNSSDCSCLVTNVVTTGVVMSGYKEQCHTNFIWVDWRKKCLRVN